MAVVIVLSEREGDKEGEREKKTKKTLLHVGDHIDNN